jgi:hypothetical protein
VTFDSGRPESEDERRHDDDALRHVGQRGGRHDAGAQGDQAGRGCHGLFGAVEACRGGVCKLGDVLTMYSQKDRRDHLH